MNNKSYLIGSVLRALPAPLSGHPAAPEAAAPLITQSRSLTPSQARLGATAQQHVSARRWEPTALLIAQSAIAAATEV